MEEILIWLKDLPLMFSIIGGIIGAWLIIIAISIIVSIIEGEM